MYMHMYDTCTAHVQHMYNSCNALEMRDREHYKPITTHVQHMYGTYKTLIVMHLKCT